MQNMEDDLLEKVRIEVDKLDKIKDDFTIPKEKRNASIQTIVKEVCFKLQNYISAQPLLPTKTR